MKTWHLLARQSVNGLGGNASAGRFAKSRPTGVPARIVWRQRAPQCEAGACAEKAFNKNEGRHMPSTPF